MKKKIAAVAAVVVAGTVALTGCSGQKTWKAEDELSEAVFVRFVQDKAYGSVTEQQAIDGAQEVCTELNEGVSYDRMAQRAKDSNDPGYSIALLVGATIWYCTEFEQS